MTPRRQRRGTRPITWPGDRGRSRPRFVCLPARFELALVRLSLDGDVLPDDVVPAELLAQGSAEARRVVFLVARLEAREQTRRDDRDGDALLDRRLNRPAALAAVLDVWLDRLQRVV